MYRYEAMKKYLNQLSAQMDQGQALTELITLCYFAYKKINNKEAYQYLSFKDDQSFKTTALQTCSFLNRRDADLIKDMIVQSFLHTGLQSQAVYEQLCTMEERELSESMDMLVHQRNTGIQDISTCRSIAELMVSLSKDLIHGPVVNLCSGEGTILSEVIRHNRHVEAEGIEKDLVSVMICRMRMSILASDGRIWHEDLLKTKLNRQYNAVYCHYPWGSKSSYEVAEDHVGRMNYSTVKRGRMDWAFVIKTLNCIRPGGKGFVLVPRGILGSTVDMETRQAMVTGGWIQALIELPPVLIPGSGAGMSLMVLSDKNKQTDFIDASHCLVKRGRGNDLDVRKVLDIVNSDHDPRKITVTLQQIADRGYHLQYREFKEKKEDPGLINPVSLKDVADVITGFQYTSQTLTELAEKGNIKIVKMGNLEENGITGKLNSCNLDEKKIQKYILRKNDILIQTKGSNSKMALLAEMSEKYIPHSNLTILRCREDRILPEYLYLFLNGATGRKKLNDLRKGIMRMSNISKSDLEEMKIPLRDFDAQKAMIGKYRKLNKLKVETECRLTEIQREMDELVSGRMEE